MYFSDEFGDVINKIEEIMGSEELASLNNFDSECDELHQNVSKLHYEISELKELMQIFEINNNSDNNQSLEFEREEIDSEFSKLISKIEDFKHLNFNNNKILKEKQESASEDEDYFEYKYKTMNDILKLLEFRTIKYL